VAIARDPPKLADISYKSTLKKIQFTEDEYNIVLHLPNVEFMDLSVEQLVLIL
jgi:4'-phosphopantetheinyl transferase